MFKEKTYTANETIKNLENVLMLPLSMLLYVAIRLQA